MDFRPSPVQFLQKAQRINRPTRARDPDDYPQVCPLKIAVLFRIWNKILKTY
jgi:hypothetical protein